jgi:hypothetical protein
MHWAFFLQWAWCNYSCHLYALSHINPLPHFIFPIILILVQPYHELNLNKTTIIRSSFTQFIYSEKKKKNCNLS